MNYDWERATDERVKGRLLLGPEQDIAPAGDVFSAALEFGVSEGMTQSRDNAWRDVVNEQARLLVDVPELSEPVRKALTITNEAGKRNIIKEHRELIERMKTERPDAGFKTYDDIVEGIQKKTTPIRERYQDLQARADGWGTLAGLGGDLLVAGADVNNVASMAVAFPRALLGAGSLLMRSMKSAGFMGAVSAGTEAAIQPFVYEFKKEIDSPYSFGDAATNILLAGLFGVGIGGAIPPAGAAAKAVRNRLLGEYKAKVASGQIKPTADTKAAADVAEQFEQIIADNPLNQTEAGAYAHLQALDKARAQMIADQPVDVQDIIAPHERGFAVEDAAVVPLDPRQLEVDAETFQFKSASDAAGVTDRLAGVKLWEPEMAGTSIVWERADGRLFVADGHQRLGLARRLIAEGADPDSIRINAFVHREADGISAREAMARAASKNIAEGTGSAIDAAKVLRMAQAENFSRPLPELPPTSALVRDARGLTKLGDDAFRAVVNEVIDERYGALVGRFIDGDEQQVAAIQMMARAKPDNLMQAEIMARDMAAAGFMKSEQGNLFGDADFETLFKERAKAVDTIAKTLRQDKRTFQTLVDRQGDIMGHGENRLDMEANSLRASQDSLAMASLMTDATTPGPLNDALNQAARDIKAGMRPSEAVKPALEILRKGQKPAPPQRIKLSSMADEERDAESLAFIQGQKGRTVEQHIELSTQPHMELRKWGQSIHGELGDRVFFSSPPVKGAKRMAEKLAEKKSADAGLITDAARAGFIVDDFADIDRIVDRLATKWDVLDEGFKATPAGYFDYTVKIRFENGTVGELQFWDAALLIAKEGAEPWIPEKYLKRFAAPEVPGHSHYEVWRNKSNPQAQRDAAEQAMNELYAGALGASSETWRLKFASATRSPNLASQASRDMTADLAPTMAGDKSAQPSSPMMKARPSLSDTTGDISQSPKNLTSSSLKGMGIDSTSDTMVAKDADIFKQAEILMKENPDMEIPDLRVDEDGKVASAGRPAREVFEELDAEGRALDDLFTCITGAA